VRRNRSSGIMVWPGRGAKYTQLLHKQKTNKQTKGRTKTVTNWVFAPPTLLFRS